MTTVPLYARISTKNKGQSTENQLSDLRRFASALNRRLGVAALVQ